MKGTQGDAKTEFELIRALQAQFGLQTRPHQGAREIARRKRQMDRDKR